MSIRPCTICRSSFDSFNRHPDRMFCDDCYEKGCAELKSKEDDKNTRQNEAISADDNVNNANKDSSAGKSSQSAIDILRTVNSIVAFCGVIIVVGLLLVSLTAWRTFFIGSGIWFWPFGSCYVGGKSSFYWNS